MRVRTDKGYFSSSLKPSIVSPPDSITLGSHNFPISDSTRNLVVILDSKLSMKKHVIKSCETEEVLRVRTERGGGGECKREELRVKIE